MAHLRPVQALVARTSAHTARACLLLVRHQTNGSTDLDWSTFLGSATARNATAQPSDSAARLVQLTTQQPISKRQNKSSPNFPQRKSLDLESQPRLNFFSESYGQDETAEAVHRQQLQERLAFQAAYNTEEKALNTLKELLKPRFSPGAFEGTTEEDKKARAMGYKEHASTLAPASKGVPNNDWRQTFLANATSAVSRNPSLSLSARQAMLEAIKGMPAAPQAPARR